MKKSFFRSKVAKSLVSSFVFLLVMFATHSVFAQVSPEQKAVEAIKQELSVLKQDFAQQQAAKLNGPTADAEIAAAVKYRFYKVAEDNILKYGVNQGVQKTYDLFNPNNGHPSAALDAAKNDLIALLNSL